MAPSMKSVASSHVSKIGYDESSEELHVEYDNGRVIVYSGVPAGVASKVMDSESIGSALHARVRGRYDFQMV